MDLPNNLNDSDGPPPAKVPCPQYTLNGKTYSRSHYYHLKQQEREKKNTECMEIFKRVSTRIVL